MRLDIKPYPRLWAAFADDAEVLAKLDHGLPLDVLTEASRKMATEGQYSARAFLLAPVGKPDR